MAEKEDNGTVSVGGFWHAESVNQELHQLFEDALKGIPEQHHSECFLLAGEKTFQRKINPNAHLLMLDFYEACKEVAGRNGAFIRTVRDQETGKTSFQWRIKTDA